MSGRNETAHAWFGGKVEPGQPAVSLTAEGWEAGPVGRYDAILHLQHGVREGTVDVVENETMRALAFRIDESAREGFFQTALANTPLFVYENDADLRYTWVYNMGAVSARGANVVIGRTDFDLFDKPTAERMRGMKQAVLDSGVGSRHEFSVPTLGGDRHFDLTIEPVRRNGHIEGVTVVALDTSKLLPAPKASNGEAEHIRHLVAIDTRRVRDLALSVTMLEQQDRHRISQRLHEETQQFIVAAQMQIRQLGKLRATLEEGDVLETVRGLLRDLTQHLRTMAIELSPPVLQGEGLYEAVSWFANDLQVRFGLDVKVRSAGSIMLPEPLRVFAFQMVRELLNNVALHSGASEASVLLRLEDGDLLMSVIDAGRGFDTASISNDAEISGLARLRERAELFEGWMAVTSRPDAGTRVDIRLPIER